MSLLLGVFTVPAHAELTIVASVPDNTPPDASIYIAGNFNTWNAKDEATKMTRQADGSYKVVLLGVTDSIFFKLTRGNWQMVEGRSNGRARPNRFVYCPAGKSITTRVQVLSWEDFEGSSLTPYILILLLAALQGIVLIFAVNKIPENNKSANTFLSILVGTVSVALLGRVVVNYRSIFDAFPYIYLVQDLVLFSFGPLALMYLQRLLVTRHFSWRKWGWQFLPFIIQLLGYMLYFGSYTAKNFSIAIVDRAFDNIFIGTYALGFVWNVHYWNRCVQTMRVYSVNAKRVHSFSQDVRPLRVQFLLLGLCLIIWTTMYVVGAVDIIWHTDNTAFVEYASDTIWVLLASTTYYLGYVAMRQPAMFKVSAEVGGNDATDDEYFAAPQMRPQHEGSALQLHILSSPETIAEVLPSADSRPQPQEVASTPAMQPDELLPYMRRLEAFIEQQQPYLNPHLTLPKLAEDLGMSIHTLSKVINDGYDKNFFDFINSYRIVAFQRMARSEQYHNLTLPAIAQAAGFNSKTAFNRAFKKMTGVTPREYLRSAGHDDRIEDEAA